MPKRKMQPGMHLSTMNARAETIGEKPTYMKSWRDAKTCLLPMKWFYEPNYESGKAERWAIGMADGEPFCVAGLWREWEEEEGGFAFSFTQITINADEHLLMKRFHKPGDEKRSLVIIPRSEYGDWLNAGSPESARTMLAHYPANLMKAWPAAKEYSRKSQTASLF
ncbi:MAG: SOS response-associated peptidase family protein, partial [Burkholderiaceae bacterium]|nr:SOS response-associated peptidase family protein [Burkholderiaceae bacterium]